MRRSTRVSEYVRRNVLGFIAIFLALGGLAVAAGLQKNSVKSKHIKDGQVKSADLEEPAALQPLTLSAGWTPSVGNWGPASCYRDLEGVVHLSGGAKREAGATSVVVNLPPKCRPAEAASVVGATTTGGAVGTGTYVAFISGTSGTFGIDIGMPPVGGQVVMDGITFRNSP